jgi:hypothetical protein
MLVDFLESLIETDKIVTQDLIDYFEEEIVEAAKSGEWDAPKTQQSFDFAASSAVALKKPKFEYDPLDADTKAIVKYLLEERVRVDTPVDCKFIGRKAVVAIMQPGAFKRQVAVVYRNGGMLLYNTVNFDNPFATTE